MATRVYLLCKAKTVQTGFVMLICDYFTISERTWDVYALDCGSRYSVASRQEPNSLDKEEEL